MNPMALREISRSSQALIAFARESQCGLQRQQGQAYSGRRGQWRSQATKREMA